MHKTTYLDYFAQLHFLCPNFENIIISVDGVVDYDDDDDDNIGDNDDDTKCNNSVL